MIDNLAMVLALLLKYGIYLLFILIAFGLISGFFKKLKHEPRMLFKYIFVVIAQIMLPIAIPYFLFYEVFGFPFWLNVVVGLVIFGLIAEFVEKRVHLKFKDE